jgi:hypothetical protein
VKSGEQRFRAVFTDSDVTPPPPTPRTGDP